MTKKHKYSSHGPSYHQGNHFFFSISRFLFLSGLWGTILLIGILAWHARDLPAIVRNAKKEVKPAIIVKAVDGSFLAQYGNKTQDQVHGKQIPDHLVQAILSIEDQRFYHHFGIDPIGIARAMVINLIKRDYVQGGSTLTQQLAKNQFLSPERTLSRKIQEAMLAIWLDATLSKEEILNHYINQVYMGNGIYGMGSAAKRYFQKDLADINIREAAILAGMLKAPSTYNPINSLPKAKKRADLVLKAMLDQKAFDKKHYKIYQQQPINITPANFAQDTSVRYFTDWIMDDVAKMIDHTQQDLVIYTTLNPVAQKITNKALQDTIKNNQNRKISQGAMIVINRNGAVQSMVGGVDYSQSQFNRATQAKRQVGSTFKPIVYLTAYEQGYTPNQMILDAPLKIGGYSPENFDGDYRGEVSLDTALTNSLNTATIRLLQQVGINSTIKTARRGGIESPLNKDLSMGLGSSDSSLLEMVSFYHMVNNNGMTIPPYGLLKITDTKGHVIYERPHDIFYHRGASVNAVSLLKESLRHVIQYGTGIGARLYNGVPVYGKTGTSQNYHDAWFMGFTDDYTAGVWVGNDNNSNMKRVTGGSIPATIWRQTLDGIYLDSPQRRYSPIAPAITAPLPTQTPTSQETEESIIPSFQSLMQSLIKDDETH
jgi:penicillin-binding protein 1A